MGELNLKRQPDDPGIDHSEASLVPIVYGFEKAELTPNTIKTIRRNAGRVSPLVIAAALRWTFSRLQRVAKSEHIDLRYPPKDSEPEPTGA